MHKKRLMSSITTNNITDLLNLLIHRTINQLIAFKDNFGTN